ncbi:unnamed protein product [Ilex paraguariensis]|uniref:Uncharacterized protein n=1 Tax=Ilex paraguariensis TaxID=185542 RepID=A0ABC8T958_9AQUA
MMVFCSGKFPHLVCIRETYLIDEVFPRRGVLGAYCSLIVWYLFLLFAHRLCGVAVSSKSEDKTFSSLLPKQDYGTEFGKLDDNDYGSRGPFMWKYETSIEASGASALEPDDKLHLSPSAVQNLSISTPNTERHFEPHIHHRKLFTPSQISSAIGASGDARFYCSLAAAILVVLSSVGLPILGSHIIKCIIFFRPLYLLLLTNISIVLARLLLVQQRGLERVKQEANNGSSISGYGLADQVGKALESGLLLQNIMSALFMDCSIYAVVVVSGLSLVKKLGW